MIKRLLKSITRREWRTVILLSLFLMLITITPIVYGWLVTPPGKVFTGVHFAAPNDWYVYYSFIQQAKDGNLLLDNLFTAQKQAATIRPFWTAVGFLANGFNLSVLAAFQLARLLLIPVLVLISYLLIATIFLDLKLRQAAFLIFYFSSGLGLLLISRVIAYPRNFAHGQFNWPMDLWVPEAFTYPTVHYSPHFIASLILILLIFWLTLLFTKDQRYSYAIWSGIAGLVLFSFHPFHVLTLFLVIGFYFLVLIIKARRWQWPLVWYYFIFGFLAAPAILYYFFLIATDAVTAQKTLQNLTYTTPVWITIFSYGLLLPLALTGCYQIIKEKKYQHENLFLLTWLTVQFLLIYSPVTWQRRMTEGLHFPLAILSTMGIYYIYTWSKAARVKIAAVVYRERYGLLVLVGMILISSNVFHLAVDWYMYSDQRQLSYIDEAVVDGAIWLKRFEDKVIFNSAGDIINVLPAYSHNRVYVGHGVETPYFGVKQGEVNWFFQKNRDSAIEHDFLRQRAVDLVFYGPDEQLIGDYDPNIKNYLELLYRNEKVAIYQVLDR